MKVKYKDVVLGNEFSLGKLVFSVPFWALLK